VLGGGRDGKLPPSAAACACARSAASRFGGFLAWRLQLLREKMGVRAEGEAGAQDTVYTITLIVSRDL
jgi:hypothetical protein